MYSCNIYGKRGFVKDYTQVFCDVMQSFINYFNFIHAMYIKEHYYAHYDPNVYEEVVNYV